MPTKMHAVVSPAAEKDLDGIYCYIRNVLVNAKAADDFIDKFYAAVEQIEEFPDSCPFCKEEKNYRKLIVGNYIAFYKVMSQENIIIIYRVLYGMMDYEKHI